VNRSAGSNGPGVSTELAIELATELIGRLRVDDGTLATAESLTGGLIAAFLTSVPGASKVYRGGVVSYATELKASLAGVPKETLEREGPVAKQTAAEMARGVAERCGTRWGLAVTGVAGPEPQDGHPVGQVYVAVANADSGETIAEEHLLSGTRSEIRLATVHLAMGLLAKRLTT
jgi:nicotinamide-nucleotide amidase